MDKNTEEKLYRYKRVVEKRTGGKVHITRPIGDELPEEDVRFDGEDFREDGFVNVLNKYGTSKDTTEHYYYQREPMIPDDYITSFYESNGLFAKIIDLPADEAVKHGFELENLEDEKIENFYKRALDQLDWEEKLTTAIRWARLYGGSIMVMLINDGGKLEDPVDYEAIESIDDIVVYERPIVFPDYGSIYHYESTSPGDTIGSRLGYPETYHVVSRYGSFTVHETRCLVFRNGVLPERTMNQIYRLWGVPEYLRIKDAIRDSEIAHGSAVKMLDRSVQAVYSMKNLSELLETEEGEDIVLKRLDAIDMARGLLNSITIDNEGESYDFRQFSFSGVSEVVETTCNYLSALTNIPQTVLFGKDPSGMNATGMSDLENYYNFVERIQKRMVKNNLRYLLSVIFKAGLHTKEIEQIPAINVKFKPLWSMSELEQAQLEQTLVGVQQAKASVATTYIQAQVLDPSEVRRKLADDGEFDIDTLLDDYTEEELEENDPAKKAQEQGGMGGMPGGEGGGNPMEAMMGGGGGMPMPSPQEAPQQSAEGQFPQEQNKAEKPTKGDDEETSHLDSFGTVGVIVSKEGKILIGQRMLDVGGSTWCGPGGHIDGGETPVRAAVREMQEEFNISPNDLVYLGRGMKEANGSEPYIFLCTSYSGNIECKSNEIKHPKFATMTELYENVHTLFQPFKSSINLLMDKLNENTEKIVNSNFLGKSIDNYDSLEYNEYSNEDGGEGSGNFGHGGRKGEVGGSSPTRNGNHREKMSKKDKEKYKRRLLGIESSGGITVSVLTNHFFDRAAQRNVSVAMVERAIANGEILDDKDHPKCKKYIYGNCKVILSEKGEVVTTMRVKDKKRKGVNNGN